MSSLESISSIKFKGFKMQKEINGTYGTGTEATIFVVEERGGAWYCVEDGTNINFTPDAELLVDGVDIETLYDTDCTQTIDGVETLNELIEILED